MIWKSFIWCTPGSPPQQAMNKRTHINQKKNINQTPHKHKPAHNEPTNQKKRKTKTTKRYKSNSKPNPKHPKTNPNRHQPTTAPCICRPPWKCSPPPVAQWWSAPPRSEAPRPPQSKCPACGGPAPGRPSFWGWEVAVVERNTGSVFECFVCGDLWCNKNKELKRWV